jgi:membrane protein insertase Oxa1/YidC/SpoIIIJ
MKAQRKFLLPLALVFVICNGFFLSGATLFTKYGIDNNVLVVANSLFLILALVTFFIQQKALQNANPNVFVRSVMAGMMIKMFACIIAIFIYWFTMKEKFSKATVVAAMVMYLVYLVVEVTLVTKLNRQKNA